MKRTINLTQLSTILIYLTATLGCVDNQGASVLVPPNKDIDLAETTPADAGEKRALEGDEKLDRVLGELQEIKEINRNLSEKPLPVTVENSEASLEELIAHLKKVCSDQVSLSIERIREYESSMERGAPGDIRYEFDASRRENENNKRENYEAAIAELKGISTMSQLREFVVRYELQKEYKKILELYK